MCRAGGAAPCSQPYEDAGLTVCCPISSTLGENGGYPGRPFRCRWLLFLRRFVMTSWAGLWGDVAPPLAPATPLMAGAHVPFPYAQTDAYGSGS
jgi:hypothetical protein